MTMTNNIAAMAVKHDNVTESIALELMVALARLGGDALRTVGHGHCS